MDPGRCSRETAAGDGLRRATAGGSHDLDGHGHSVHGVTDDGGFIVDVLSLSSAKTDAAPGGDQTEEVDQQNTTADNTFHTLMSSEEWSGSGTRTMSWSWTTAERAAHCVAAVDQG